MVTPPKEDKVIKLMVATEKRRGRMTKKKKDEVMKWKSFTLCLLLLVMVGKRIKEPGIFIVMGWK